MCELLIDWDHSSLIAMYELFVDWEYSSLIWDYSFLISISRKGLQEVIGAQEASGLVSEQSAPFFIFIPLIDCHTRAQPIFLQFWPTVMTFLKAWFQYLRWHESIRPYKFASKAGNKLREDSSKVGKKKKRILITRAIMRVFWAS